MDSGHTTDPLLELGLRLDRCRRQRGLTVEELADRADLDRAEVRKALAGRADAGISLLLKLAGALDLEAGELLTGITWVPDGHGDGSFDVRSRD